MSSSSGYFSRNATCEESADIASHGKFDEWPWGARLKCRQELDCHSGCSFAGAPPMPKGTQTNSPPRRRMCAGNDGSTEASFAQGARANGANRRPEGSRNSHSQSMAALDSMLANPYGQCSSQRFIVHLHQKLARAARAIDLGRCT